MDICYTWNKRNALRAKNEGVQLMTTDRHKAMPRDQMNADKRV